MAENVVAAELLPKRVGCSSAGLWLPFYRVCVNMALWKCLDLSVE